MSEEEIAQLITIDEVLEVVELAFKESALGYVQMPPKIYLKYQKDNGDLRTMPSYLERLDTSAVKVVTVHPDNSKKFGLPTVMGTLLLVNPKNGQLQAIMGARNITALRTGAAGGVAAKYLANKNPQTAGFIGTGFQAKTQLMALLSVFAKLRQIKVWDISPTSKQTFTTQTTTANPKLQITPTETPEAVVTGSDIVVTTTPATKPIVQNAWVSSGTHFNCIGADAPTKEELDPAILRRAKIIVDNWDQASHSGEINVPVSNGMIRKENIWAELGEIVAGTKPARSSPNEITVFDSTGLAIQDAVTAELIYRKAIDEKAGHFINL